VNCDSESRFHNPFSPRGSAFSSWSKNRHSEICKCLFFNPLIFSICLRASPPLRFPFFCHACVNERRRMSARMFCLSPTLFRPPFSVFSHLTPPLRHRVRTAVYSFRHSVVFFSSRAGGLFFIRSGIVSQKFLCVHLLVLRLIRALVCLLKDPRWRPKQVGPTIIRRDQHALFRPSISPSLSQIADAQDPLLSAGIRFVHLPPRLNALILRSLVVPLNDVSPAVLSNRPCAFSNTVAPLVGIFGDFIPSGGPPSPALFFLSQSPSNLAMGRP